MSNKTNTEETKTLIARIEVEPQILVFDKKEQDYLGWKMEVDKAGGWNVYTPQGKFSVNLNAEQEAIGYIWSQVNPTNISLEEGRPLGKLPNKTKTKAEYLENHDNDTAILRRFKYKGMLVQVTEYDEKNKMFICICVKNPAGEMELGDGMDIRPHTVFAGMYDTYLWRRKYKADLRRRRTAIIEKASA